LSAGASADVALFSVGAWKPGQSMLWDLLSDDDRLLGERDGVVADICGVIVTAAGEVAMSDLSERIIAIGASALRRIPRRVAVVLGTDKTDALISALRSGLITDLVVEADAARALLKAG
jgi:DNA-binding transcriptional regulator LsrR (DeoR family)